MIPIQTILVIMLVSGVVVYFRKLRSRLFDGVIVVTLLIAAMVFVLHPTLANRLAAVIGVGRGADLFFYISIPGLAFAVLLLLARIRTLEQRTTVLIRELALHKAESTRDDNQPGGDTMSL